jgi:uncharacterized membrane protein YsdA (DUF1294 family)/cold shock CspA family protein
MRMKGKIIKWNDDKGFGFIKPNAGGDQIFLHISAFHNRSHRPVINEIVAYDTTTDSQGRLQAKNATLAGDELRKQINNLKGLFSIFLSVCFLLIISILFWAGYIPIHIFSLYWVGSFLTFIIYAKDKSAAQNGRWRTSESTLHLLALVGGWPGASIAQQKLRHKSKKQSFRAVFWCTVLLNCCAFMWILTPNGAAMIQPYLNQLNFQGLSEFEAMLRQISFSKIL